MRTQAVNTSGEIHLSRIPGKDEPWCRAEDGQVSACESRATCEACLDAYRTMIEYYRDAMEDR